MEEKIVIYDVRTLPKDTTIEEVLEVYYTTKVILYESNDIGNDPYVVDINNIDDKIGVIYENKSIINGPKC